ncbi:hypothetical protein B0A55_06763 [Friedmanniomyces simplex]|uniref:Uncharacterized protein n=1 Tax=Friedmanniomyces simplex TaxID=329884 RepID=A0A4U0X8L7_9PEZI|nr:hypothetical protein B0A55_06763 [Friedmanniomyces simplex]
MAQPPAGNGSNGSLYSNGAAVNGSIMPSAGHYADMQTLMQSMETLSGWLQQNREEWASLQEGLARVERVQAQNEHISRVPHPGSGAGMMFPGGDGLVNGDTHTDTHAAPPQLPATPAEQPEDPDLDPNRPTLTTLQSALSASHSRISSLESQLRQYETLQTLYESTLSDATDRIRQYCFEQQNYIISLHRHYTTLLQQSREELVDAQLVHQGWQEGLQRLSGLVREAYGAREEERRPWVGRVKGLKEENRRLRAMVGWEVGPDGDSDEEEEEGRDGYGMVKTRGRLSGGSLEAVRGGDGSSMAR